MLQGAFVGAVCIAWECTGHCGIGCRQLFYVKRAAQACLPFPRTSATRHMPHLHLCWPQLTQYLCRDFVCYLCAGIPAMSMNQRDQARRFITLVDELYNARCLLVCSAALPPDQLFAGASGEEPILDLEGLQFEGAVEGGDWSAFTKAWCVCYDV